MEKSTYCSYYRDIKEDTEMQSYWQNRKLKGWQEETWARWRFGCAVKEEKKGYEDKTCRACDMNPGTLEDGVECKKVSRKLNERARNWWENWRNQFNEEQRRHRLIERLKGEAVVMWCKRLRDFESVLMNEQSASKKE